MTEDGREKLAKRTRKVPTLAAVEPSWQPSEGPPPAAPALHRDYAPPRSHHRQRANGSVSVPMEPSVDPDDPPELNMLRGRATALMSQAVKFANELRSRSAPVADSMLDDIILQGRISGLSVRDIALRIDPTGSFSEQEVINRLSDIYARQAEFTSTEWRQLQTMRLEMLINAVHGFVLNGSESHAEVYLKALERLNKLYDLESTRTKLEISIVSDAQAVLFLSVVDAAVRTILSEPRVTNILTHQEIQRMTGIALDAAQKEIEKGQGQRITIDG